MSILKEVNCSLFELEILANNLVSNIKIGDVVLLDGDLGVGKTTFARFFINSLYDINQLNRPSNIKSPSYPILINYPLKDCEINHYDLYRLKNINELNEIDIFENFKKNISLIEWPNLILKNFKFTNYYLLKIKILNKDKRIVKLEQFLK